MERTLGPRNFDNIIRETFLIYKNNFLKFAGIVAIAYLPIIMLAVIFIAAMMIPFLYNPDAIKGPSQMLYTLIPAELLLLLVAFIAITLMQGALVYATAEQYFLQPVSIGRALRFAWQRIWNMLGAVLLAGLAVTGIWLLIIGIPLTIYLAKIVTGDYWQLIAIGVALAVICIPAAVYLGIFWAFTLQTALLESCRPTAALSRSWALVKGSWWRVLGISLLLGLIQFGINLVSGIIPFIGGIIAIFISMPIATTGLTLLYFDLRVRKQAYSLDALANELGLASAPVDTGSCPPV